MKRRAHEWLISGGERDGKIILCINACKPFNRPSFRTRLRNFMHRVVDHVCQAAIFWMPLFCWAGVFYGIWVLSAIWELFQ